MNLQNIVRKASAKHSIFYFGLPYLVVAFLVTFLPFALCGFLHMDGFMDCSDAILSRRPLEDRQRILKDSHTGAFAVISIVFYILAYFAFASTAITIGIDFANMILLVCLSRSVSGLHVLIAKPMRTSQYVKMNAASEAAPVPADDDFSAVNPAAIKAEAAADSAAADKAAVRGGAGKNRGVKKPGTSADAPGF